MRCAICNRRKRPMIFKGQPYCSEQCRKTLVGEA